METKYQEIMKEMLNRISDGHFKPGDKLPSIRSLSEDFGCSLNTIVKAYSEMEKEHKIYSVPKSGYYLLGSCLTESSASEEIIDFSSAGPDRWNMPYRDYQHCMNQAIELYKEEMFQYSEPLGLQSLRYQLAQQLQDLQVFTSSKRICVVSGSQQALDLLVSLPFPNEKEEICVEQPTHFSFIDSITSRGLKAVGIEISQNGIDLDYLEKVFKERSIKFFYTVSRFQNPTGYSYTNEEKRKADPMFAYDPSGRVIYTKSFSKVLLPGLRLGMAVLPEELLKDFSRAKFAADVHTPVLTQGALEIYLSSGMYHAHIQKLRRQYKKKGTILKQAYLNHLPSNASYSGGDSGFYSMIKLPSGIKAKQLVEHLKKKNVLVQDATNMYLLEYKKENRIRLSVSQVEDRKIPIGVKKIGEGIRDLQR